MVSFTLKIPYYTRNFQDEIRKIYEPIIRSLNDMELIKDQLIEIIVTDNLTHELERISIEWNLDAKITKKKEYLAIAKSFTNIHSNPNQHRILVHFGSSEFALPILYHQIIGLKREYYLPKKLLKKQVYDLSKFYEAIEYMIRTAVEVVYIWDKIKSLNISILYGDPALIYLEEFQRKIKRIHYEYQSNLNIDSFGEKLIQLLADFLIRCVDAYYTGMSFESFNLFKKTIENILEEIFIYKKSIDNSLKYDFNNFVRLLDEFLKLCYIRVSLVLGSINNTYIQILKNPKTLFKNELLDTQNCFVAYVDILGFSNLIAEYENDPLSNKLKMLKKALDTSIDKAITSIDKLYQNTKFLTWGYDNFKMDMELLDYKMYSDCFSFSLPFFDNKKDFIAQLASLLIVLRIFQHSMLQHGFVVRGGLSYGSYYSDRNIIFSGGLVKACNLEKKASMPGVIIDPAIIEKIKGNNVLLYDLLGLTEAFVMDKQLDNKIFINPFGIEKEIELKLSCIADNIESLCLELGIDKNNISYLFPLLKLGSMMPDFENQLLKLDSPFKKFQVTSEAHYEEIISFIDYSIYNFQNQLDQKYMNNDQTENKEKVRIILKYRWLKEFIEWYLKGDFNDKERFYFPLKQ